MASWWLALSLASGSVASEPPEWLAATEVRVAFAGAVGAPEGCARTDAEARALAFRLFADALAGESLESIARRASDAASAARGGGLGPFPTPRFDGAIEDALRAVAVGEVALPVRTSAGWHVVRRDPAPVVGVRWALVASASDPGATGSAALRSDAEARALAEAARTALDAGASPAADVAGETVLGPGTWASDVTTAVQALPVGRSTVVRSGTGWLAVRRTW